MHIYVANFLGSRRRPKAKDYWEPRLYARRNFELGESYVLPYRKQMMRAENPLCPKGCYVEQFYIHETMSTTRKDLWSDPNS